MKIEYQTPAHQICPKGTQPNQEPAQNESRINEKTKRHAGYALNEIEKKAKENATVNPPFRGPPFCPANNPDSVNPPPRPALLNTPYRSVCLHSYRDISVCI
jgi:hypothetical protein